MLCFCTYVLYIGKNMGFTSRKKSWCIKEGFPKVRSGPRKKGAWKEVKVLSGGKMLEVGEDPGDQRAEWR